MKEVKMTLNDKGIGLVVGIISALILLLGIMCGMAIEKGRSGSTEQRFSVEQSEKIRQLQAIEDENNTGYVVYGKYDKNGNFVIGWSKGDEFDRTTAWTMGPVSGD